MDEPFAVRSAQPRLEAPEVRKRLERRVPLHPAVSARHADRLRPVVKMLVRVAAEVRKRLLVRIKQVAERLAQARNVDTAALEAERQQEDVPHHHLRADRDPRLAPVNGSARPAAFQTASASPQHATAPPATAAQTASPSRTASGFFWMRRCPD